MNYINLLEKLRLLAENHRKVFCITQEGSYYAIKIGDYAYYMDSFNEDWLFNAVVFFTAKIELKAEVLDF